MQSRSSSKRSQLDPDAVNAWNGLGWARFNSGDSEGAIPAFEKCVELEPNHPAALNGLGQVYLSWREFDQAKKFLTKAAPQAPAAWYGLARLYLLTGKYTAAERWIKKALATSPNDESLKKMLAAAEAKQLPDELRRRSNRRASRNRRRRRTPLPKVGSSSTRATCDPLSRASAARSPRIRKTPPLSTASASA